MEPEFQHPIIDAESEISDQSSTEPSAETNHPSPESMDSDNESLKEVPPIILGPIPGMLWQPQMMPDSKLRREGESCFLRLPVELLLQVYSYLDPVDGICLALSCKAFYNIFNTKLDTGGVQFPRLSPIGRAEALSSYANTLGYVAWLSFLRKLENARMACCSGCLKLHPRDEFTPEELCKPLVRRRCMVTPLFLDLCPCITLTARDRAKVVRYLLSKSDDSSASTAELAPHLQKHFKPNNPSVPNLFTQRRLTHHCTMAPQTNITISLSLNKSQRLSANITYRFPEDHIDHTANIDLCPHRNLGHYLYVSWAYSDCLHCQTDAEDSAVAGDRIVEVVRRLGKGLWDEDARKQSRIEQDMPFGGPERRNV